ncbi:type II secretion system F family protein [Microbacterium sp. SORGH_AS_0888]|uniref:type II secretion system F family protein n=1 Tax=Microbacterium sp. SORGH_AS_0888 TaxID=3041791 RepID=UPI0027866565|nr:type II secretion system F family protein [Microbacterium sp. SORGH_AS_0888]MDQ1128243.1 tight adherence protein B [Microbacterium sp. SORGH_AS_0888]
MTVLWGALLAAGILLMLAPRWWPAGGAGQARRRTGGNGLLAAAGLARFPAAALYVACAASALVAGAITWLLTGVPVISLAALLAGAAAPVLWLRGRVRTIRKARRMLWPDVCDLLIGSVRAGLSLPDAVATLRTSAPQALRPAFAAFATDLAASGHFGSSVDRLKATLADPVADRILETLRMAREVGGTELVPVLRALAAAVRAEANVRAEAEARQSWVRGAAVLGVVAPWVVMVLLAMRPEGARAYSSPEGIVLIVVSAVVSVVAFRLMLRIGRLAEQRRWFG